MGLKDIQEASKSGPLFVQGKGNPSYGIAVCGPQTRTLLKEWSQII